MSLSSMLYFLSVVLSAKPGHVTRGDDETPGEYAPPPCLPTQGQAATLPAYQHCMADR
ncbi:hypothetical protein [Undibacterium sp. YM2]|uniref:hypothetical protein n=1 Tax=Undibacterium sp. YM2 TaxID=2058625 RepID=UPI00138A67E6|nr:hypothetical protein [Undibacterium sp. YM2]